MDLIGWGLFAIGALLLVLFAFIGIDVNGISITNLTLPPDPGRSGVESAPVSFL